MLDLFVVGVSRANQSASPENLPTVHVFHISVSVEEWKQGYELGTATIIGQQRMPLILRKHC